MRDHSRKFNNKSVLYSNYRPSYPKELLKKLVEVYHLNRNSIIADIGSGTGIMTQQLLTYKPRHVYAVEPNSEMRKKAEDKLNFNKDFTSIDGTAEKTTLDSNSIDFIIVAQAFHWFDREKFREECKRILKPGGKVMIISNNRIVKSPIIKEVITIYNKYCPEFCGFSNGLEDSNEIYEAFFKDSNYMYFRTDHPLSYNKEGFIGRHLSASYAPKVTDRNYSFIISEFHEIFDRYENRGMITLPNETIGRCGEII